MSDSKWQQGSDDEEFSLFNYDEPEVSKSEELDDSDEESGDSNAETEDLEDPTKLQDNDDSDELDEDSEEEEEEEDDDTSLLSLEDKVKQLQGDFKSFPPLMIKRVLQREDVKGDLHAARSCLKGMSYMEGSSKTGLQVNRNGGSESNKGKRQNAPKVFPKKKYEKSGKCENRTTLIEERIEIEEATVAERASEAQGFENPFGFGNEELDIEDMENEDAEYLSLEEKVKILQEDFKGFPPFVIRKVLGRQDVKEDLQKATECLKNMSPLKGTFKDRDGGGEDASQEQKDRGRRQAWEQKKGKTQENQGKDSSDKTDEEPSQHCWKGAAGVSGGAQGNSGKNQQKNKRKNKGRNRKQNKGGNERNAESMGRPGPSDSIPREGWPGGHQQGGYHQQWGRGEFPQQSWGPGGYPQQSFGPGGYPQLQWGYPQEVRGGINPGGRPRGRGRHNRGGNQRGYFPKGDGRDYQRGHAGNYYHDEANFGPHQWAGHGHGQRPGYPYNEGYPMPNQSAFHRSQSEADIRNDGVLQRGNRGQARQRCNSRGSDELNPQNARGRGGHRWVGRGAGRGTRQQTAAPQITSIQDEIQNFEPHMILVRGLNTSTTFDAIRNFIEARTSEEVRDVARVGDGNALVTVKKLSDFVKAKENVEGRTLDGAKVTIHRVPVTSSILVQNLSPDTTHDALEFYFSNQRIGGEVTSIQYEKGNSQAVVTFKDPEIMQKVLRSKSLKLNDAKLTAERFNPTIQESNQRQHSKDEIAVAVEKDVMEFISTTNCVNELKETLSGLGFDMNYTAGDTIVYIAPKTTAKDSANKQRGIKAVTDFAKKFKTIELDVDANHWDAVTSEISKLQNEIGKNKLLLKEASFSKDKVTIICRNCDAEGLKRKFSENIAETQTLEVKKTYEKNEMPVEEEKLALLKKIGFKEKHLSEYSELEAEIDQDSGAITMIGPKKQCSEAKIKIYKHLSKMNERKIPLSQTVFEMLSTDEGLERIKEELMKKQLETVFCIDENNEETTASVVGINKKHADDAAELIKSITTEIKVKVDKDMMEVLRTQKWSDLCDEIKRYFKVYVRRNEFFDTWIAGFKEDVSSAHDKILRFLDDNSVGTEKFCCLDKGVRRYILEHRKEEISKMESTLSQYSVKIKPGEAAEAFLISGTKIGVARVQEALHILTGSVAMNEMKVQQPGLHKFFTSGRGDRLVKSVEHEHQCTIYKVENASQEAKPLAAQDVRVSDGSFDSTSSSESDEEDQASAQAYPTASIPTGPMSMTCGNVKISWKPGNIETESADILVGSTIGQLSKVFQRAGVPQMQQHRGNVSLVSQCGNLPCNHVILTKCCNWDGGNGAAEMQLRSIVQQCLQQALQMNARSLAFPVIGTGGLGFPNNTASRIMISEVIRVTSGWGTSSLNDIRFVVFAQDAQLTNAFQQEFTASSSGSQTVQGGGPSHFQLSGPTSGATKSAFGNVSVQVYQGDIVQEQTDAIVNINSTDMNMQNAGALSKAVAVAAGPSVQNECTNLGQQNAGSAVVTGAGSLMVSNIIHMIPGNADKQHIQSCIEKCLRVADSNGFQSISMPAFGTGSYGMSDVDSAQATFQALANECPNLQSLGQVNIVIFQLQMVRTFQQTLQQYAAGSFKQSKPRKPVSATKTTKASAISTKSGNEDDVVKTIQFRLFGKSQDCVDKAQTTLTKGLTEAFKTQTVENENASKLSERQRLKLKTKARKLDVTIKFEDRIQRIVVRGDPEDVSVIINDIWEEIQERHKKEKENEQAEVLYKTIKWRYELHGQGRFFNKSSNAVIEKAHANNDSRVTVEVQGEKYVIVFAQSTGTGLSTGQKMSVTRTTVGSAAGHGEGIALPKEWSQMPNDFSGKEKTVHLVSLALGSTEYQKVLNLFQSTGGRGQILKIERIQNPHLYQQYMVRKQKMDKDNPGMNNERELFHGTAEKNLNDINTTGFNRSYCGINGTAFGNGVYFAVNASYSTGYAKASGFSNNRHMYLARVLTGQSTPGHSGLIVPPKIPNRPDASFDSVTGYGGSVFVVFYDAQCYPEYLITFQ